MRPSVNGVYADFEVLFFELVVQLFDLSLEVLGGVQLFLDRFVAVSQGLLVLLESLDPVVQRVELLEDWVGLKQVFRVEVFLVFPQDDFFLENELRGFSDHVEQCYEVRFSDFHNSISIFEQLLQGFVAHSVLVVVFEVGIVVDQDAQGLQLLHDLPRVSLFRVHVAGLLVQRIGHSFVV